jgi:hypothetical protein
VARPKSLKTTLDALAAEGFTRFALVDAASTADTLELKSFT